MEIEINPIKPKDLTEAVNVLGKAFSDQPAYLAVYRGRSQTYIEQHIKPSFAATLKYMPGKIYIAKTNGTTVGVMRVAKWPDCSIKPQQIKGTLPLLMKIGDLDEIKRTSQWRGTWTKREPKKFHCHLDPIGVIPDLQGQGIGSQMLKYYCDYVDKLGMAAYHETDRPENVKLYEHFGFQVIGEEIIMDFQSWYMWRDPLKIPDK